MNVKLLKQVKGVIKKNWKYFNMSYFTNKSRCGTSHCIGGWIGVIALDNEFALEENILDAADLTFSEGNRLFYCTNWPEQFTGKVDFWRPSQKQVLARIDHFIKTDGEE